MQPKKLESVMCQNYNSFHGSFSYMELKIMRDEQGKFIRFEPKQKLTTKNAIANSIEAYRRNGNMKKCVNLTIAENYHGTQFFPKCREDSLDWFDESETLKVLEGCPDKCHFFSPVWKQKLREYREIIINILTKPILIIWNGYNSQPPTLKHF